MHILDTTSNHYNKSTITHDYEILKQLTINQMSKKVHVIINIMKKFKHKMYIQKLINS